jgi:hypothetical protein
MLSLLQGKVINEPHLVARLRTTGAVPPPHPTPYIIMVWIVMTLAVTFFNIISTEEALFSNSRVC